jgi:hypothetical protein
VARPVDLAEHQARLERRQREQGITPPGPRRAPDVRTLPRAEGEAEWADVDRALDLAEAEERRLPPNYRDTLLPDGARVVIGLRDVDLGRVGGAEKWLALFTIQEVLDVPEGARIAYNGATLLRSWNAPARGWIARQHALAQDWQAVTGRPLRTVPKTSPRAIVGAFLRGVLVEAETHVVKRRMDTKARAWVEVPDDERYSVVSCLVRLVAGTPRVLLRKPPQRREF